MKKFILLILLLMLTCISCKSRLFNENIAYFYIDQVKKAPKITTVFKYHPTRKKVELTKQENKKLHHILKTMKPIFINKNNINGEIRGCFPGSLTIYLPNNFDFSILMNGDTIFTHKTHNNGKCKSADFKVFFDQLDEKYTEQLGM